MPRRRTILKLALGAGLAGGLGAWVTGARRTNAYYQGPVSDHFDGVRFFNPAGHEPKGLGAFLRWHFLEPAEAWPATWPSEHRDRPPARVEGKRLRIAFVGHATFLLQTGGLNILLDPVWSERASPVGFAGPRRVNAPGVAFDDLPRIDVVLVSHNHYDHLDVATLGRLWQRDRPRIVTPLGNDTIIAAATPGIAAEPYDWGGVVQLAPEVTVHVEPSHHWSARGTSDRRHALWASFVVTNGQRKVYAVADTGFGDGRTFRHVAARHPGLDVALLPIGAYEPRWFMKGQHVDPEEAVRAFMLSGAARALGHHWGTFRLTNEAIDAPPQALATALFRHGIAAERFRAMRPGEVVELA
jgi:L-ascorbate metabolism protein UlaG (beta-lactamase superfamily)